MTPCRNSPGSNISCEKKNLRYQMRIKTGIVLGIKIGNAKLTFVFEIDRFFINYLCMMTLFSLVYMFPIYIFKVCPVFFNREVVYFNMFQTQFENTRNFRREFSRKFSLFSKANQ